MAKTVELQKLVHGDTTWFVGQRVAVSDAFGLRLNKISRITSGRGGTIYVGKSSFTADGSLRGSGSWPTKSIRPATDEDIENVKARIVKIRLSKINWDKLSNSKVFKIYQKLVDLGVDFNNLL